MKKQVLKSHDLTSSQSPKILELMPKLSQAYLPRLIDELCSSRPSLSDVQLEVFSSVRSAPQPVQMVSARRLRKPHMRHIGSGRRT